MTYRRLEGSSLVKAVFVRVTSSFHFATNSAISRKSATAEPPVGGTTAVVTVVAANGDGVDRRLVLGRTNPRGRSGGSLTSDRSGGSGAPASRR
mmetsp:Transcript_138482/g.196000  ORF Transcript_138482/g.196000 Transcript_138482/m.196000 type:complete len:94 (-) Transcript_138482:235-516(-)